MNPAEALRDAIRQVYLGITAQDVAKISDHLEKLGFGIVSKETLEKPVRTNAISGNVPQRGLV